MSIGFGVCRVYYRMEYIVEDDNVVVVSESTDRIKPSTKMVYEYYYPEDDVTDVYEDLPSYFLIDYTLNDIKRVYSNWDIVSFSDKEVVMRRVVKGPSNQRYKIGEKDGYIAVFYDGEDEVIKEITDKPVASLTQEDKSKIHEGIKITGNDKLIRAIEDLTS